jgi:cytochrome c oxidase cbb3-type subunit 3
MRPMPWFMVIAIAGALVSPRAAWTADADASLKAAKENYTTFCAKCHGDDGKGNGPSAATLNPKPRDYTDCKTMGAKSDAELFKVISEGGDSVGMSPDMQPWGGTLTDDEIHDLVKYVRSFCKKS